MKFNIGKIVFTSGVTELASTNDKFNKLILHGFLRHIDGDWGDLCEEDKAENELSIKMGFRLLSAYESEGLPKIWIITEADRSVTTVLFPFEY